MTPDQIAATYDELAHHWDGESFDRRNGIEQHRGALEFVGGRGFAIDIGCGSSGRIIELMIAEGFEAEGLDISPEMIRRARHRHPDQKFYLADICGWEFPKQYDFISAWDSIWHAPLDQHEAILRKLCSGLTDGGVLIFSSGGVDGPDERTDSHMGKPMYHAALGIRKLIDIITQCGGLCRHLEYDQWPENHIYLIVQKQ